VYDSNFKLTMKLTVKIISSIYTLSLSGTNKILLSNFFVIKRREDIIQFFFHYFWVIHFLMIFYVFLIFVQIFMYYYIKILIFVLKIFGNVMQILRNNLEFSYLFKFRIIKNLDWIKKSRLQTKGIKMIKNMTETKS